MSELTLDDIDKLEGRLGNRHLVPELCALARRSLAPTPTDVGEGPCVVCGMPESSHGTAYGEHEYEAPLPAPGEDRHLTKNEQLGMERALRASGKPHTQPKAPGEGSMPEPAEIEDVEEYERPTPPKIGELCERLRAEANSLEPIEDINDLLREAATALKQMQEEITDLQSPNCVHAMAAKDAEIAKWKAINLEQSLRVAEKLQEFVDAQATIARLEAELAELRSA
jgi:hypothetical protein